jgi:hypothetical protein
MSKNNIKGAGILIIENYKNNIVAVLFGDKKEFSDLGGVLDDGETPLEAACREAREESANLFKFEPNELKKNSIPITILAYKCYIVYVKGINATDYRHNINQVLSDCRSRVWKENDTMVRVPLKELIKSVKSNDNFVTDVGGREIKIRPRAIAIVKAALNELGDIHLQEPYYLYQNVTLSSKMKCLIGTYTYTFKENKPKNKNSTPRKSNNRFAIFIVPNLKGNDRKLHDCNIEWGGLHVTLVGFSTYHPPMIPNLKRLSSVKDDLWKIDMSTMRIQGNAIYFDSDTLDRAAEFLARNTFQKVKGPKFSNVDWHITFNCPITTGVINTLERVSWKFVIVEETSKDIIFYEEFPVKYL